MKYFVIEGIDTSGKSTQYNLLKNIKNTVELFNIENNNIKNKIILVKEPSDDFFGKEIRKLALDSNTNELTRFLLFLAERSRIFDQIPFSENIVISERSLISGIAYSKLNFKLKIDLNLLATNNILPSKAVILKLSKEDLTNRLKHKELDSIESTGVANLLRIQDELIKTCELLKEQYNFDYKTINASEGIDFVFNEIRKYFEI